MIVDGLCAKTEFAAMLVGGLLYNLSSGGLVIMSVLMKTGDQTSVIREKECEFFSNKNT